MNCVCPQCGSTFDAQTGAANRALKIGAPLYCGRVCAGLARRLKVVPTGVERKAAKAAYDRQRRHALSEQLRAEKRAYYAANRDRILVGMTEYRRLRMPKHVEYCRRPRYKAWKAEYDRGYLAKKKFGEFAEAALLLADIEREIESQASRYEIYMANGTINKAQTRRRAL